MKPAFLTKGFVKDFIIFSSTSILTFKFSSIVLPVTVIAFLCILLLQQMKERGKTMKKIGKAIMPDRDEIDRNPRARSAVLRIAERLA